MPTPHSAPHSEVDQPALSKVDSAVAGQEKPKGSEDGSMTPSEAPMAESSEKAQAQSSPDVPSPAEAPSEAAEKENAAAAAPVADRGVTVAEEDQLIAPAIQAQALPSEEFGQVMRIMPSIGVVWVAMPGAGENELTQKKPLDAAGGEGDKAADKRASEPAAASEPATAAAQSAKPLGTQTPGMENKPQGEKSNKESNPFSVKEMLKFEAGKPLAVKGLEVQTTNPVISDVALITGNPSSPTVEISFNAKGKAARVEFLRRTGRTEWDDSIDHAMHEWTVSGELLKKLQREKPGGVITIRVRILLQ